MAHMSRRFNFDEFDKLCAEALEEDHEMAQESADLEEEQKWADYDRVFGPLPGQIGGVACRPTLTPDTGPSTTPLPDLPDNVVDLNRNVVELRPPDDAA